MPGKDFKNILKGHRAEPAGPESGTWAFDGLLRDKLEQQAERLPVEMIALDRLQDNAYQHLARTEGDPAVQGEKLEELAESIRANGFYGALLARMTAKGYQLAYGHRRREAARLAGLTELPVKVMELSDEQMARIMASENFSREDLSPLGEANVVGHLYDILNMSVRDVAQTVGKSKGWVQIRLELYRAPQYLKEMVQVRPDSMSFVASLMAVEDPELRQQLSGEVTSKGLTRDQLRSRIEPKKPPKIVKESTTVLTPKHSEKGNELTNDFIQALEQIAQTLGTAEEIFKKRHKPLNLQEQSLLMDMMERIKRLK